MLWQKIWSKLKLKRVYIPLVILLLIIFQSYRSYQKSHQPVQYDTAKVTRGNLEQTVEATGKLESVNGVALRFDTVGSLAQINVKEGDVVKSGDVLATLRLADLNASVAQAAANLNQKLAGATDEDRSYYEAAMNSAQAAYEQSKVDAVNAVNTYQAALDTAKNNLKLVEGGDNSRIVSQAYEDAVAVIQASLGKIDDGLTQADNILGIDNTLANDTFQDVLSILDSNKLNLATGYYATARTAKNLAKDSAVNLSAFSAHADIDKALPLVEDALSKTIQALAGTSDVLKYTPPVGGLTQTTLDAKKTAVEASRAAVVAQYATAINQRQTVLDAKNSLSSYQVAYDKAVNDLATAKANAENSVKMKEAAYQQATANYQSKINPPREVDVAAYRAALQQAVASRDKAIIKAPFDGVIAKVNNKVGESVSGAASVIEMLSPHYEIKVDISETDVAKVKVGNLTKVTLDAFGEDVKFGGTVMSVDPASTDIQDVVYYKVTISLDETAVVVKAGMTANIAINSDKRENILSVPLRSVRTRADGSKYVRLLVGGKEQEVTVTLGLKANESKVEILTGLREGQEVILSVKS